MGQITSGLRAILSSPLIYEISQQLMGAHRFRIRFVKECIRAQPGNRLLDIGCGPAAILNYLPQVDYWGFDINPKYIADAKTRFGSKGHFYCQELTFTDLIGLPPFDIALAIGVLHHLDDPLAEGLLRLAYQALRSGGRLLTVDPVLVDGQNLIARFLIQQDRGCNVRGPKGYQSLAERAFNQINGEVHHRAWIPYSHWFMECIKH